MTETNTEINAEVNIDKKKPKMKRLRFNSKLKKINSLSPTVKEFIFTAPSDFNFLPGQYVTIKFTHEDESGSKVLSRAYSIASYTPLKEEFTLCIKIVEDGEVTPILNSFEVGKEIKITGPMGDFTCLNLEKDQPKVFISTGTGIAPLKTMIEYLQQQEKNQPIFLFNGFRFEEEILYSQKWLQMIKKSNGSFHYQCAISRPKNEIKESNLREGRIQVLFDSIKNLNKEKTVFFICGLSPMILESERKLIEMEFLKENIFYEQYDN